MMVLRIFAQVSLRAIPLMIVWILGVAFALIDFINDGDMPRFKINHFIGPEFLDKIYV